MERKWCKDWEIPDDEVPCKDINLAVTDLKKVAVIESDDNNLGKNSMFISAYEVWTGDFLSYLTEI